MKKLIALVLALLMLGSVACAEDVNLSWDDVAEAANTIEGEFKTFDEISVKIWIPDVLKETELSDADRERGYIGYFMTDDQSAAVAVQYVNMESMSLDDYQKTISEVEGVTDIEKGTVNGLDALSYEYNGNGVIAFTTEMGYILEVSCGPLSDEGFKAVAAIVISSIQPAE